MHTHTYKNEYIYICDEKVREKNEREEKMFVQYLFTASWISKYRKQSKAKQAYE